LKLIGFGVWERRTGAGRNVTFPARQYSVNGERRSFALLRPIIDAAGQDRIRDLILEAYGEHEAQGEAAPEVKCSSASASLPGGLPLSFGIILIVILSSTARRARSGRPSGSAVVVQEACL
jgi:hypothetical protein